MGENPYSNEVTNTTANGNIESVKNISDALKKANNIFGKVSFDSFDTLDSDETTTSGSDFKIARATTNLPEKTGFWTKLKNALFYEIKIELTPYQQKIEDEINDYLHQEITWKSLKEAALSEVPITFKGKRIF